MGFQVVLGVSGELVGDVTFGIQDYAPRGSLGLEGLDNLEVRIKDHGVRGFVLCLPGLVSSFVRINHTDKVNFAARARFETLVELHGLRIYGARMPNEIQHRRLSRFGNRGEADGLTVAGDTTESPLTNDSVVNEWVL